ncbi:MAG: hypothetical protein C4562_06905 [Actinobacteria bacterium]|nr:MAG: hypothetical protein C4562_06905 [Actinomycetota bacterium]
MKKIVVFCSLVVAILVIGCSTSQIQKPKKIKKSVKQDEQAVENKKSVTVYVPEETANSIVLKPIKRSVGSQSKEKQAIEALLESDFGKKIFPKNTTVLSIVIVNDLAKVDFSQDILNKPETSASHEEAAIYAIVNTLTQFQGISKVTMLVEGKQKGKVDGKNIEDFWGHVGLYDQPFRRNEELIK